jgi:acetyl esterase/lipase
MTALRETCMSPPLLAEVPPIFPSVDIPVAGSDGLRDEGISYTLKLRDGGVDAQLEIVPGAPHGLTLSPTTHAARQFYRNQARVLNIALNMNSDEVGL